MYASLAGNKETVKYLLSKSANINIPDKEGNDAFILVIKLSEYDRNNNHLEIIKQLLNNKTDINYCNNNGITPFTGAVIKNWSTEVLDLLLAKGAKVNIKDKNGLTAMDYCPNGKIKAYLKAKGALKGKKIKNSEYASSITAVETVNTNNTPTVSNSTVPDNSKTNNATNTVQNTVNTNSTSTINISNTKTTANTTPITTNVNTTNNNTSFGNNVTITTSGKKFFIIAGSYDTEQEAKAGVALLQKNSFTDAEIVGVSDKGKWRVCYKGYKTKEEAMKDLPDIKNFTNPSAWIYEKK